MTGLLVVLTAFSLLVAVADGDPGRIVASWGESIRFLLMALAGVTWALAERAPVPVVRILDALLPLSVGITVVVVLWGSPASGGPELLALLVVTLVLLVRSALVPSSSSTTVGVGLLAFAPTLLAASHGFGDPAYAGGGALRIAFVGVWTGAAVVVAATCSHIVYDLRSRMLDALRLGPYQLGQPLGRGGLGQVFEADHARLKRPAAIKLLHPDLVSERALACFEQEVQIIATLRHPNTVAIYDYGRTSTGMFFYVMELVGGLTLYDLVLQHGPIPSARAVHLLLQIAGALAEAHSRGLVHRDVKPANIMVSERAGIGDFVTVLDFGLAHPVSDAPSTALVTGTPRYLAPETIHGLEPVRPSADLYALGVTAYFALTGTHPFEGDSVAEICAGHLRVEPVPPSVRAPGGTVEIELEQIVLRLLEKDARRRFSSADELLDALDNAETSTQWNGALAREWWRARAAQHVGPTPLTALPPLTTAPPPTGELP